MAKRKHLIIGSGSAGLSAAEEIRQRNSEDEIRLVTAEDFPPYSPTALPYLLSGRTDEAKLPMRKDDYFRSLNATFLKGKRVAQLLPQTREVAYEDSSREHFDTLLIASGSEALMPAIPGLSKPDYLTFHTLSDCRRLKQRLDGRKDVTVYGGGLVAIELAIALLEMGHPVKIIVRSRILRRYFDVEAAAMIKGILAAKGAQIYEGHTIEESRRGKGRMELSLSGGNALDTDILAVALGVVPAISFLSGSGIKVNTGVVVDRRMQSSLEDIYAAGDVAEAPDFFTGQYGMNQIIWSAMDEGKVAGANMAGVRAEYEGWISSNIFNFFGNTAFSAGLSMPEDKGYEVLTEKDERKIELKRLVFSEDRLVGAMLLNIDVDPGVMLYLMNKRLDISADKQLLFQQPRETSRRLMLETDKKEAAPLRG